MYTETFVYEINSFHALYNASWGGAKSRLDTVEELGQKKIDIFISWLNEVISICENGMTETELNDLIWFEDDYYMKEILKVNDYE